MSALTIDQINHWLTKEERELLHLFSAVGEETSDTLNIFAAKLAQAREMLSEFEYSGFDVFGGIRVDACDKCSAKPNLGDKHIDCPFSILDEVREARL